MPWEAIAAIGTVLTAGFTGGYLVIAWRAHRHAVIAAGRARPVVLQSLRVPYAPANPIMATHNAIAHRERLRMAYVRLVNQSDLQQAVAIDQNRSRVIWPMAARHVRVHADGFDIGPQKEADLWLPLAAAEGNDWPTDRINAAGNFGGRYYLRLRGRTARGKRVCFRGRVVLGPYR
jgi:hypothetical protein